MSENQPEEIKRDKFGGIVGETTETPGMVRWYSKPCHYFLKRRSGPDRPIFALGLEHRIGDEAFIFDTSIEFDDNEAPDLMDRIAEFNGLPKYTELQAKVQKFQEMVDSYEANPRIPNEEAYFNAFADGFRAGIHGIKHILKGHG